MKFSMTGQKKGDWLREVTAWTKKGDLLIQVTAWAGLTVINCKSF